MSNEIRRAVKAFDLTAREVRDSLIYGFKRSFFPGSYLRSGNMCARCSITRIGFSLKTNSSLQFEHVVLNLQG